MSDYEDLGWSNFCELHLSWEEQRKKGGLSMIFVIEDEHFARQGVMKNPFEKSKHF